MTTWTAKLSSVAALLVFAGSFFPVTAQTATGEDSLITIESDTQSADNITGVVTAVGNVRIVYPARGIVATSRQAQYFSREAMLVLSGDVDVVQDDGNSIRAERVTYNLDEERALANPIPGQQVQSTLFLKQSLDSQTPLTP
ncbi:LptA/OstA family protein [Synechococcus sp. SYN20]|uniref:LptA/OstA family protein n=1 Tax=Synechococcus sp. SYN20 TaxID=1050714 RepID=UPI0021040F01|nr:LptA/OstA family protein [Synechococcus sp. SYN20]